MGNFSLKLNNILFHLYLRRHTVVFLSSLISLLLIAFNVFGINALLSNFNIPILTIFLQILTLCATAFTILFLPNYPLFFILLKKKEFTFLEKLGITISFNLAFFILIGYLGNSFGIPITGFFYFLVVATIYFLFILFIIIKDVRRKTVFFLQKPASSDEKELIYTNFSFISYCKSKVRLNIVLLFVFLILLSVVHSIRFSYFYGTDAMYHVFMMNMITKLNYLPTNQYFGALGLHIFGAVINFFSNINVILIGKYFLFYTYFVSALIFYNILKRIFKNQNIAIFGVFLLESSSLGFSVMMYEFWPTSLATILSLEIFFLLYVRLQNFIKLERPDKKNVLSNISFNYALIILLGVSAIFTHSLISMIYIVSFSFIFLIYFVKNYRRGIDFIVLCIVLLIFLALYDTTEISLHWRIANFLSLPWYFFILGGIGGVTLILYLRRGIDFSSGRYKAVITGKKYKYYKTLEDKFIFPLLYSSIVILLFVFWYLNVFFLDMYFSKILILIESLIFGFFCYWGLILFQKRRKGKPLYLWLLGLIVIYLGAFSLDVFVLHEFWSGRILLLFSPVIIIGFMAYFFKMLKLKLINTPKMKFFILFVVIFSFFAQYSDLLIDVDGIEYNLYHREVKSIYWYAKYTDQRNLIICEFGLPYVLYYYDYPYEENNKSITTSDIIIINQNPLGFFKPEDHFYENGTNKLQQLKAELNTDIYLILDDNYLVFGTWEVFQRLTEQEMASYYYMDYLNRIASCKSENGIEVPYYWVI